MKTYITTVAAVFTVIALVHLWRALAGWEAVIGGWEMPLWVSYLAVLVAGALAVKGWKLRGR